MTERSGMQMLEEILAKLDLLDQKIKILDNNVKHLMNGSNLTKLLSTAADTKNDSFSIASAPIAKPADTTKTGFKNFKFEYTDASKDPSAAHNATRASRNTGAAIPVNGKLKIEKNGTIVPLSNINVTIYDADDFIVKQTRTNRAGHWMSQLQPGNYVVLFEGKLGDQALTPQNRNFTVPDKLPEGQDSLDVS